MTISVLAVLRAGWGLSTSGGTLVVEVGSGVLLEPSSLRCEVVRCLYKYENFGLFWRMARLSGGSILECIS